MVDNILYSIIEFLRGHPEISVTLLITVISVYAYLLRFTYNGYRRLNTIYEIHGKKSSSIKHESRHKNLLDFRPVHDYYELDEYGALKEALKSMNPASNVIIPRVRDISDLEKFEVPINLAFWRKTVLILDDIDKFTEKQNFRYLVDEFLKKKAIIISSCRTGVEFDKLRKNEWLNSLFNKNNIITFPDNIPDEKGKEIAAKIGVEWNPSGFDGKIGSLVMPLNIMQTRFTECPDEEKALLKAIRLLYLAGIYEEKENFSKERILKLCKELFEINHLEKYVCDVLFSNLEKKNFIKVINDETIWAEEAYLVNVIEADSIEANPITFFNKILEIFLDDDRALFSLGNRAYSIGTIDINKK